MWYISSNSIKTGSSRIFFIYVICQLFVKVKEIFQDDPQHIKLLSILMTFIANVLNRLFFSYLHQDISVYHFFSNRSCPSIRCYSIIVTQLYSGLHNYDQMNTYEMNWQLALESLIIQINYTGCYNYQVMLFQLRQQNQ